MLKTKTEKATHRNTLSNRPLLLFAAACLVSTPLFSGEVKRPSGPVSKPGKTGSILCEYFKNIPGDRVDDLAKSPNFPNKPDESILLNLFEIPPDSGDAYGTAVRGYLFPPTSGNYTFWIASDDWSELWLSPSENPAEKIKVCQMNGATPQRGWDQTPEQKSRPIPLAAGRTYYIEALHKQGGGGDNLSVGWQLPDQKMERPIPGSRLAPANIPKPPPPVIAAIQGTLPMKTGFHKCMSKITGGGAPFDFPFLLYVPPDVGKAPMPTLLFLHGVGESGTDLEGVYGNGPHGHVRNDAKLREKFPFLCIGPQCAPGRAWSQRQITKATVALLDEILRQYGNLVDKERVYMTGLSMGGQGTWCVAEEAPDRFAAIVPSDPKAVNPELAADLLKDMPVWIIAGGADGDFTKGAQDMFEALKNSNPKPELKLIPNSGHGAWSFYYPRWEFYQWLLKWKRKPEIAAAALRREKGVAAPLEKPVAVAKPVEVAKPKPAEPAKPLEVPKGIEILKPKPVEVAKPAVEVAKPPVVVAKPVEPAKAPAIVEAPKVIAEPAKVPDAPKVVSVQPTSPPPVAKVEPVKPIPESPVIAPAKNVETTAVTIQPKPVANPIPEIKVPAKPKEIAIPPIDDVPVADEKTVPFPSHFPYAPVSLLIAVMFFGAAAYYLTTEED